MKTKSDVTWQNYLDDATNAIMADKPLEPIRKLHNMNASEDGKFIGLIQDLNSNLVEIKPSAAFSKELKAELMGQEQEGVVWRIRKMPARVQIAAIIAAVLGGLGGILLIIQGIVMGMRARSTKPNTVPEES
jgi:hypothetical protein